MKRLIVIFLALALSACAGIALNPDVNQETVPGTICISGYTKTIRPPTSYTNRIKYRMMREAGIPQSQSSDYALDHVIPLVLGGSPTDEDNLRFLTRKDNSRKSRIEVKLRRLVCSGQMTLADAQRAIYDDWEDAYRRYASIKSKTGNKHGLLQSGKAVAE
jgi:hypothetical protein